MIQEEIMKYIEICLHSFWKQSRYSKVSVSKIVVVFRISVSKNLVSEKSSVSVLENLVSEKSLCSAFGKFDIRKGFSVSVEILVLSHSDQHECFLQHMHCIAARFLIATFNETKSFRFGYN